MTCPIRICCSTPDVRFGTFVLRFNREVDSELLSRTSRSGRHPILLNSSTIQVFLPSLELEALLEFYSTQILVVSPLHRHEKYHPDTASWLQWSHTAASSVTVSVMLPPGYEVRRQFFSLVEQMCPACNVSCDAYEEAETDDSQDIGLVVVKEDALDAIMRLSELDMVQWLG